MGREPKMDEDRVDDDPGWKSFKKGNLEGEKKTCPACGRQTSEELAKCEHCTSDQEKRWSVRRITAVGLAILLVGAVFLSLGAIHEEPVLDVEDLSEDHSFRTVRLKGEVVEIDHWEVDYSEHGRLEITIFDGTGLCPVYIEEDTLEEVVEGEKLPYIGDTVDVHGRFTGSGLEPAAHNGEDTVRVDGSVNVLDADLFEVKREEYEAFDLEEMSAAAVEEDLEDNTKARLRGYVGEHRDLSSGDALFYLYRGTEQISVTIPRYSLELTEGWREDIQGRMVTVRGTLNWYEPYWETDGGSWELVADGMDNIDMIDTHFTYDDLGIDELSQAERDRFSEGSTVEISGSYEWYTNVSAGELMDLHHGPSSVTVFFPWYTEAIRERLQDLTKGDIVEVKGTLDWYEYDEDRGEWQIIPDGLDSMTVVDRKGYDERDVSTLLDEPGSYEYEYVNLQNVVVSSIYWSRDDRGEDYTTSFFVEDESEGPGAALNIYIDHWEERLTDLEEGDVLNIQGLFRSYTYQGETEWEVVIRDRSRDEIIDPTEGDA